MYTCMPSRRLASLGSMGFFICGACRSVEASIAPMANFFSKSEGVWSARRLMSPNLPVTYAPTAKTIKMKMIPRIKFFMASPPSEPSSIYLALRLRQGALIQPLKSPRLRVTFVPFVVSFLKLIERIAIISSPRQLADTGRCLAPNRLAPAQKHPEPQYPPPPAHRAARWRESPASLQRAPHIPYPRLQISARLPAHARSAHSHADARARSSPFSIPLWLASSSRTRDAAA